MNISLKTTTFFGHKPVQIVVDPNAFPPFWQSIIIIAGLILIVYMMWKEMK